MQAMIHIVLEIIMLKSYDEGQVCKLLETNYTLKKKNDLNKETSI